VPGAFLLLTAELAASGCAPVAFLAACKHPLAAGGQTPGIFKARVRLVEQWVLRGPRPAPGFDGLRAALAAHKATTREVGDWLAGLQRAAEPFATALAAADEPLSAILRHHLAFAEWLAADDSQPVRSSAPPASRSPSATRSSPAGSRWRSLPSSALTS